MTRNNGRNGWCIAVALTLGMSAMACEKSADQQARELNAARVTAEQKNAEAINTATEKSEKAAQEANLKIAAEQQKLNEKAGDTVASLDKSREALRQKSEEKLGEIDKRIVDLRTRISTGSKLKKPKSELETTVGRLQEKSTGLRANLGDLRNTSINTFDTFKTNIEARLAELVKSLDEVEGSV